MDTPDTDLALLGVAVARLRGGLALTLDDLAEATGLHRKTIIQIEAGRVSPRIVTLGKIADALEVSLAELVQNRTNRRAIVARESISTFQDLWEHTVATHGANVFLVFRGEDGETTAWTYLEFEDAVGLVAGALAAAGIRSGDSIHVALKNSPAFVAVWLAAARLGAWIVSVDPLSASREIEAQIRLTGAKIGVYAAARADVYEAAIDGKDIQAIPLTETAADLAKGTPLTSYGSAPESTRTRPSDRLALMFTSGTTSQPKGVELTQANYLGCAHAMSEVIGLDSSHRWFVTLPLFHGNAHFYCFAPAIAAGASVALTSSFSASGWFSQAAELRVTHASLFAAPIRMILARRPTNAPQLQLRHLWFAQSLGAAHYEEFADLVGVRPRQLYGLTESVVIVSADLGKTPTHNSIGKPFPGREVAVLDTKAFKPVRDGVPGMIAVQGTRGVDLFGGYLDRPDNTAESFLRRDGRDWFLTGDLARRRPDGSLEFVGRVDDVIKVSGENVSLTEVEAALAEAPGVLEVAVVAAPDPIRDHVPIAFVVPSQPSQPPEPEQLAEWAERNLSPAARPREWRIIDALPRTSVGKIRRFKLPTAQ